MIHGPRSLRARSPSRRRSGSRSRPHPRRRRAGAGRRLAPAVGRRRPPRPRRRLAALQATRPRCSTRPVRSTAPSTAARCWSRCWTGRGASCTGRSRWAAAWCRPTTSSRAPTRPAGRSSRAAPRRADICGSTSRRCRRSAGAGSGGRGGRRRPARDVDENLGDVRRVTLIAALLRDGGGCRRDLAAGAPGDAAADDADRRRRRTSGARGDADERLPAPAHRRRGGAARRHPERDAGLARGGRGTASSGSSPTPRTSCGRR